jgi:hypothetical protein
MASVKQYGIYVEHRQVECNKVDKANDSSVIQLIAAQDQE